MKHALTIALISLSGGLSLAPLKIGTASRPQRGTDSHTEILSTIFRVTRRRS